MNIWVIIFLAWVMQRANMVMSANNIGAPWNGYGALELTYKRDIKAPMAYRILVPILVMWIEKLIPTKINERMEEKKVIKRITIYEFIKIVLNVYMIWALDQAFGTTITLITLLMITSTFMYDYWDYSMELGGLAMIMTGDPMLACIGAFLWGLSRETALIAPLAYYLATFDQLGTMQVAATGIGSFVLTRMWAGKKERYADMVMINRNLNELMELPKHYPVFEHPMFYTVVYTLLALVFIATVWIYPIHLIPLIILAAGWIMGVAVETRMFVITFPFIAQLIMGIL